MRGVMFVQRRLVCQVTGERADPQGQPKGTEYMRRDKRRPSGRRPIERSEHVARSSLWDGKGEAMPVLGGTARCITVRGTLL